MSNYTETRVSVTLGGGKAVHTGLRIVQNGSTYAAAPECGGNKASERYRETTAEVTCKKCLKFLAAEAEKEAAYQDRLEASMTPATEDRDFGFVAEAGAEEEQPADVIAVRETARDAAEDARVQAALLRASVKLAATHVATPVKARCNADLFDPATATKSTCALAPGHDRGVINSHADRLHASDAMLRDRAHREALGEHLLMQDSEDIARDLRAVITTKSICTCGHGAHSYGPCSVGPRPLDGGGCDCDIYQPSGLEGVYDPQTQVWGVRPAGTQMATWLPFYPARGGLSRNARIALAKKMIAVRNG